MKELPIDHPPVRGMKNGAAVEPSAGAWKDITRWLGAGVIVLMAHAAGAYALHASLPEIVPDGEPPAAIMIELDPVPQAPEVADDSVLPSAEASQNPDEAEEQPEEPVEQVEEVTPAEPVEELQEVAEAKPVEEVTPEVPEAPKPEVVLPKKVEQPKKIEKKEPKPEKPKEKPKPKEKAKKTQKAEQTQAASAPQINAKNSSRVAANTNRQSSASAGVSSAKWQSKLYAHLNRKKRSAQRAIGRGNKGIVNLTFVIDPAGNVLSARANSGNPVMDQAAVQMVKKASPVPAPPPAIAEARKTISVPIKFD